MRTRIRMSRIQMSHRYSPLRQEELGQELALEELGPGLAQELVVAVEVVGVAAVGELQILPCFHPLSFL